MNLFIIYFNLYLSSGPPSPPPLDYDYDYGDDIRGPPGIPGTTFLPCPTGDDITQGDRDGTDICFNPSNFFLATDEE